MRTGSTYYGGRPRDFSTMGEEKKRKTNQLTAFVSFAAAATRVRASSVTRFLDAPVGRTPLDE
jgi:hypothetical protein